MKTTSTLHPVYSTDRPISMEMAAAFSEPHWAAMIAKATPRGIDTNNANSVEPL
jgi:hypothetical protein